MSPRVICRFFPQRNGTEIQNVFVNKDIYNTFKLFLSLKKTIIF